MPSDEFEPVPERWRPALEALVDRLVTGDYAGLARDGFVSHHSGPDDNRIGTWIVEYGATLVELPPEAWATSGYGPLDQQPGAFWVDVNLWTEEEGRSDLTLQAIVRDDGSTVAVVIEDIHVL